MNGNGDIVIESTNDHNGIQSYVRFDKNSTLSTSSSIVLSSCSSDDENDDNHYIPPPRWKRQKILNNDYHNAERLPNGGNALNNLHIDRNNVMSAKENIATTFDDERRTMPPRRLPPIPEDKLHRRNPQTVRQELKMLEDLVPETTLADVHLSEMPGLHNTEQWKRIAGRTVQASPPLSRQYYQTVISTVELQDGQIPQPLGSYRRPGRSENEQDTANVVTSPWLTPRRRIFFGSSVAVIIVTIVVAVVLAITLVQKPTQTSSDYYAGSILVRARFDSLLLDLSSPLANNYRREFCSLIGTTLADTKTKYAVFYATCTVNAFRNGSIAAEFVLGFTRYQNVTRLNSLLNRTLVNKQLFGGTILSIAFNSTISNTDNLNSTDDVGDSNGNDDDDDDPENPGKYIMTDQNSSNEQQPTRTTYTTVTYTTLDKGLSITISETITITNNNNDKSPINNKNYELILVPTIENTKTVAVPTVSNSGTNEKTFLSPPPPPQATTTTTNVVIKSPSEHNLLRPIKPLCDTNFAYIDESSDDRTISSGDVISTLEDFTTQGSASSASTSSLNEQTLTNSASTITNDLVLPLTPSSTKESSTKPENGNRQPTKAKNDSSEEQRSGSSRPKLNIVKRQRRMVLPKSQRRLLQYELMPTGKVYYVDRPFYNENRMNKIDNDESSSAILSTILSRSSSLDTLSDKRYHHHHHQQRKQYPALSLKKNEQKLSIGGRLASNNNLVTASTATTISSAGFKPIKSNKKRFSSFEPTPESLDRVFDVLIAADKRREEHEFWREKFDHRPTTNSRPPIITGRAHDIATSNTIPSLRAKQTTLTVNSTMNNTGNRSQSYTNKRSSLYEAYDRQSGCLLEDCLRRRTVILQQQQQQQRNYSPNTIYSTNYPKQQLPPNGKPPLPPPPTNQQPVRIFPLSNGRISRAPQARQTSDELSSISDVWATRSSLEDDAHRSKKPSNHARFQSVVNRNRANDPKPAHTKRASSVEQQKKSTRTPPSNKNLATKSKFFDLFKFTR